MCLWRETPSQKIPAQNQARRDDYAQYLMRNNMRGYYNAKQDD